MRLFSYRPSPDFVLVLVIIAALVGMALYFIGAIHVYETSKGQVTQSVTMARQSLPQKCAPYYNDGTEQWIDCMGVGYK